MDYSTSFTISAAGMRLERMRLDVASMNLANANTSAADAAHLYQPRRLVGGLVAPSLPFTTTFDRIREGFGGQQPAYVVPMEVAPRMAYEPGNPIANEQGQVMYPGVNTLTEMLSIMTALRGYEANVVAFNAAKVMSQRALDLGISR